MPVLMEKDCQFVTYTMHEPRIAMPAKSVCSSGMRGMIENNLPKWSHGRHIIALLRAQRAGRQWVIPFRRYQFAIYSD